MPVAIPFIAAAAAAAADVAAVGIEAATLTGVLSAASLGFSAGAIIGNVLFPTHTSTSNVGPRLGDLSVQSSTYGVAIPITYGTDRLSGNVIWALPIQEVVNNTSSGSSGKKGGKGSGASATNTTYSYFGNFAVGLCEGVKGQIIRIWANSALIYDTRTGVDVVKKFGVNFGFYGGSETQVPDAHLEADKGVGNVPAFRGLCYVVFVDFALADYGNQLPSLSFEVSDQITFSMSEIDLTRYPSSVLTAADPAGFWSDLAVDPLRTIGYAEWCQSAHLGGNRIGIARFSLDTMVVDKEILWSDSLTSTIFNVGGSLGSSFIVGTDEAIYKAGSNALSVFTQDQYVARIDPVTLRETSSGLIGQSNFDVATKLMTARVYGADGSVHDFIISIIENGVFARTWAAAAVDCRTMTSSGYSTYSGNNPQGIVGSLSAGYTDLWLVDQLQSPTEPPYLAQLRIFADGSSDLSVIRAYDGTDLDPSATGVVAFTLEGYDLISQTLVMTQLLSTPSGGRQYLVGSSLDGTILWSRLYDGTSVGTANTDPFYGDVQGTMLGTTDGAGGPPVLIDTADGTSRFVGTSRIGQNTKIWDSTTLSYVDWSLTSTDPKRVFIGRQVGLTTTLGAICADVSARVGNAAVDTTEIDTVVVAGYTLSRADTAANGLNTVLTAFQVDVVETDFNLVFRARGSGSVVTLTEDLLVRDTSSDAPEPYKEGWQQAIELPSYLSISYEDQAIDYQVNTQHDQRVLTGAEAPVSTAQTSVLQVPIAMAASTALQMAQTLLYTAWLNRHTFQLKISPRYLWLDSADVVELTLNSGYTLRSRLGKTDLGADFSVDTLLISETDGQYVSALTVDTVNNAPLTIVGTGPSVLLLLDTPLLHDADEVLTTSARGYWGASTFSIGTYHGATLFESADAANWTQLSAVSIATPFGHVEVAPPDPTLMWLVETGTSLTVSMVNGSSHLVSVSDLDLCNGHNPAALIKTNGEVEILQYRDVTALGGDRFTLSNLLRGRRGTDTMAYGHVAGEVLVLLGTGSLGLLVGPLSERNVRLWFGAVTSGALPNPNLREAFTFHARDKMPYAPVDVTAALIDGDVLLTWVRRTRIGGALRDGIDAPLSEVSERYEVDVLAGPGGTVLRTLPSMALSVTYGSSDILSDFGFTPPTLTVRVYQLSAAVGRGFSYEVTLPTT